ISSSVPQPAGAGGRGGSASATSAAATRNPASIEPSTSAPSPAGSHTSPEGTPYMTTNRASADPRGRTRAIQGPAHENELGSATGARPSPSPPSHRETVHPVAGSSPVAGRGSSSKESSR